jgi:hypothetical protein
MQSDQRGESPAPEKEDNERKRDQGNGNPACHLNDLPYREHISSSASTMSICSGPGSRGTRQQQQI